MSAIISYGSNLGLLNNAAIDEAYYDQLRLFLRGMDALVQGSVLSTTVTAPPSSPNDGDAYLLMGSLTGIWSTKANQIAVWADQATTPGTDTLVPAWDYYTPKAGWTLWANDLSEFMYFNGTAWVPVSSGGGSTNAVVTNPTVSQTIIQPTGTAFTLVQAGGGNTTIVQEGGTLSVVGTGGSASFGVPTSFFDPTQLDGQTTIDSDVMINGDTLTSGEVGILGITGSFGMNSKGQIYGSGGFGLGYSSINSNTTIASAGIGYATYLADATAGSFSVTLPDVTTFLTTKIMSGNWISFPTPNNPTAPETREADVTAAVGVIFVIKKIDSTVNTVTIATTSSQLIDGASTFVLTSQYQYVILQSNATGWSVIGKTGGSGSGVSSVTGISPIVSSGGTTPTISVNTATTSNLGVVKPDGTTITITSGGVISSTGGGGGSSISIISLPVAVAQGTTATTGFSLPSNNAPIPTVFAGTNAILGTLNFPAGVESTCQYHFQLPPDFDNTQAIDLILNWRAVATSGSVVWGVQTAFVPAGSVLDASWNTASTTTTAAQTTTLELQSTSILGITSTGAAASDEAFFNIYRLGSGSDTMTGNAELISAILRYRRT
jgi:hypothetical protein